MAKRLISKYSAKNAPLLGNIGIRPVRNIQTSRRCIQTHQRGQRHGHTCGGTFNINVCLSTFVLTRLCFALKIEREANNERTVGWRGEGRDHVSTACRCILGISQVHRNVRPSSFIGPFLSKGFDVSLPSLCVWMIATSGSATTRCWHHVQTQPALTLRRMPSTYLSRHFFERRVVRESTVRLDIAFRFQVFR